MNTIALNDQKLNKVGLICCWIAIFLAGSAGYFYKNRFLETFIIWGICASILSVPTIVYFIKKDSHIIRYMSVVIAYIMIFSVSYSQHGEKDNLFILYWAVAFTVIFFDKNLTIFSVIFGCTIISILFAFFETTFFPEFVLSEVITLCVSLIVVGILLLAPSVWGKKLVMESLDRESETKKLNEKMTRIFNSIVSASNTLDTNIAKLDNDANTTREEINQITMSIQQTSTALDSQTKNTYDSIQSLYRIEDVMKEVTKNSEQMRDSSNNTYKSAEDGKEIINELVHQIHVIKETVNTSSDTIVDLSSQSKLINDIVSLINDVATQINLLSLNASIEAARAGEQGRGFAVVANEIKNLANQTSKSVNDITQILEHITQKINNATDEIKNGNIAVEKGINITNSSYNCFIDISDKVNEIRIKAEQVHQDINHLSKESIDVFKKIEGVGELARESASSMEEVSASTENQNEALNHINALIQELINQSKDLKNLVSNTSSK